MNTNAIKALLKCEITVKTAEGKHKPIHGLFRSTSDALLATLARMNELCCVSVRVL